MAPKRPSPSVFIPRTRPRKPAAPILLPDDEPRKERPTTPRPPPSPYKDHLMRIDFDDRTYKSHPSDLASGHPPQLYEGNFDEWLAKAETMLASHSHSTAPLTADTPDLDASARAAWWAEAKEAVRLVKAYIRPEILDRIPAELQNSVHHLVPALRKVATPFRLMDLPPELRLEIFQFSLQSQEPVTLITTCEYEYVDDDRRPKIIDAPSLLAACRQLREEALPIYYSVNEFRMVLGHVGGETLSSLRRREVKAWVGRHNAALEHLRHMTLVAQPLSFPALGKKSDLPSELTIRYKPGLGIQLKRSTGMSSIGISTSQVEYLEKHASLIEEYRKASRFEGEAVAFFFATSSWDWEWLQGAVDSLAKSEEL